MKKRIRWYPCIRQIYPKFAYDGYYEIDEFEKKVQVNQWLEVFTDMYLINSSWIHCAKHVDL